MTVLYLTSLNRLSRELHECSSQAMRKLHAISHYQPSVITLDCAHLIYGYLQSGKFHAGSHHWMEYLAVLLICMISFTFCQSVLLHVTLRLNSLQPFPCLFRLGPSAFGFYVRITGYKCKEYVFHYWTP